MRDMGLKEERVSCERGGFESGDLRVSYGFKLLEERVSCERRE